MQKAPQMQNKRGLFSALLLLFFVLLLIGILFWLTHLQKDVEKVFGPAEPKLSYIQRLRYSLKLYQGKEQLLSASNFECDAKFTISQDESVSTICQRLEDEGLVLRGDLSCAYLIYSGRDRVLQSGTFTLPRGLNAVAIANRISDPAARDILVTVFPGWRIEEISESAAIYGDQFPATAFEQVAIKPPAELAQILGLPASSSAEGYIEPGNYSFPPQIGPETVLAELVGPRVRQGNDPNVQSRLQELGLSWHELITLASIIQRESPMPAEMPLVASVFYNRLALGMRLEMDSTAQYALGRPGAWWKMPLSGEDLAVDSVYNTYRNEGLPPGPICSPSQEAIHAALNPEASRYLFFVARCDGSGFHNFSVSYDEHLEKICP
jgi:UPF0755 protein